MSTDLHAAPEKSPLSFYEALKERKVSFADQAAQWFEAVLPEEPLIFDIEKGTIISEMGANTWHRVLVATDRCLFTWHVNGLDDEDEDTPDGSHFETAAQIVPFSQVVSLITRFVHSEEGEVQTVSATLTLASQDFAHNEDDQHITIFHDVVGLGRSVESDNQEEVKLAKDFVLKLAAAFAASR